MEACLYKDKLDATGIYQGEHSPSWGFLAQILRTGRCLVV
jgi:hypothetical protein